ncbi:DNA polymerase [Bacillus phage Kioshi]|nr:DNA polymerase [Bacillus phage Kioshi]
MKALFLQEFVRESHMQRQNDGSFKNIFFQTNGGKLLKKLIHEGLELTKNDYYIDYAFFKVPDVITRDNRDRAIKYKPPTAKESKPEYEKLYQRIVQDKPDIIIPSGKLGCKALLNIAEISKLRGVPQQVTITANVDMFDESAVVDGFENSGWVTETYTHTCWVMPIYSMEYMLVNPKIQNLVEADFGTLKKYVEQGDNAFIAKDVKYEDVTTIERVREIFTKIVKEAPVVAWDLETNTLQAEKQGSKPLVISLSWKEGTGVTIPLEHKDWTWLPGHLAEIYNYIKEFVADPKIIKVGHNIKFDIRFLRLSKGFTEFNNHRDTKTMYYLLVNQDVKGTLRLSDLTFEFTDMGGYDRALEDFKKDYKENYKKKEKERIAALKAEWKEKCAKERADVQQQVKSAKGEIRTLKKQSPTPEILTRIERLQEVAQRKYVKPPMPDFGTAGAPVNPVDGSDFCYEWIPLFEMLSPYASGDVDVCLRIYNQLDQRCKQKGLEHIRELYTNHYPQLSATLAKIESTGIKLNIPYVKALAEAYQKEEDRLVSIIRKFPEVKQMEDEHRQLYQMGLNELMKPVAERDKKIAALRDKYKDKLEFNANSPDDKKEVMYKITGIRLPFDKERLVDSVFEKGLKEEEIEWFHYKTNTANMEYIAKEYPEYKELMEHLIHHSLVKTRKQSFTYKFLGMVDMDDILHGTFNPEGTETSRLSSKDPNCQNFPRKTEDVTRFDYQYPIKRMFISRFPNGALLQLDYSSLESRIMALIAYDEEMIDAFLTGKDVHTHTASLVFKKPEEEVTGDERTNAKRVTFGLAYGEAPFSFAPKYNMTVKEAEKLFDDYFKNKPKIKTYIDETKEKARQTGFISCMQGFTRNLRDVYSQDKQKRNGALRQSVNTQVQGSGAYLTNNSLIYINNIIEKQGLRSRIVLTVHDSIVIDCPPEEIHMMAHIGKTVMENLPIPWLFIEWKGETIRFPITADVEIGTTYNDMVNYDKDELNTFQKVENYCKYHMDLKSVKHYKESGVITEEKAKELKAMIESKKHEYQMAI